MKKLFTLLVLTISFSMNAQTGSYEYITSSLGHPAISIGSYGDVQFSNDLQLSSIDSELGNSAISIGSSGDVSFSQDVTVSGDVVIQSDARLKSNIVSLGSTLPKLLQIDGKSYEMKGKQKIGVLAQEIKEVFPELVSEDDNEMLAVNYQGLVPVLINALKEQDEIIKSQEQRLSQVENLLAKLND